MVNPIEVVLDAVVDAVPQWYKGSRGAWRAELKLGAEVTTICSHRAPTPLLESLLDFVESRLEDWHASLIPPITPSQVAAIGKAIALEWLRLHDDAIEWPRLLAYMEQLKDRTHENQPLSRNLLITPGTGKIDVTWLSIQKALDPLASSSQVFMSVDPNLRFLGYEEITWDQIREPEQYTYSLEFLIPFAHYLADGGYSMHLTKHREIVALGSTGLVAAERRNRWYVYDPPTLRDSLADIIGSHNVGCNLSEIIFDLSYKRHGALLVYDPDHTVLEKVVNRESVLTTDGSPDEVHRMLSAAAKGIKLGSASRKDVKKGLLIELATLDGAVLFDAESILAFGVMIRTHPDAGGPVGARTTAAVSAYLDGGTPVKVSCDGDVCIIFSEEEGVRTTERARLQFL